jgi:uncharacterized membrane protein YeiH
VFPFVDALALGTWAAAGAQKALGLGLGWLPAVLLGTITAVGGGTLRDVLLRRIPSIFGGNTLYATSAVLASAVMIALYRLGYPVTGLIVATLFGGGLTLLARWRGWHLPDAYLWRPSQVGQRYPRPRWRTHTRLRRRDGTRRTDQATRDFPDSP